MSYTANAGGLQAPVIDLAETDTGDNGHAKVFISPEEWVLLRSAVNGDEGSKSVIFLTHRSRVYSLCLRMLSNHADAEDMTQDVFIQVFRKLGSFQGNSVFTTWLHRLTVNQVLMHFRKRRLKHELITEDGELPELPYEPSESRASTLSFTDSILLDRVVNELPQGYRNVFVLHDIEGFEHEEVALILGCSVGTSKSQLHKARLKLQKLIKRKANPRLLHVQGASAQQKSTALRRITSFIDNLAQGFDEQYKIELPEVSQENLTALAEEFDFDEQLF